MQRTANPVESIIPGMTTFTLSALSFQWFVQGDHGGFAIHFVDIITKVPSQYRIILLNRYFQFDANKRLLFQMLDVKLANYRPFIELMAAAGGGMFVTASDDIEAVEIAEGKS